MTTPWGAPPPVALLTGHEHLSGADATVRDFWSWSMSDLRTNTVRSMLAEFLVARAVGSTAQPRIEWDAYDVVTPERVRVEVKSSAYLQAWEQSRLSSVVFSGLNARTWTSAGGHAAAASYNADVYVFALQTATEHAGYDPLDVGQWLFWVLPRSVLSATRQRSIGLARVQTLAGEPVAYADLAEQIAKAHAENRSID